MRAGTGAGAAAPVQRSGEMRGEEPHRESAPGWAGGGAEQPPLATSLPAALPGFGSPVRGISPLSLPASDTSIGTEASDTTIGTETSDTRMGTEASDTRRGTEASDTSIGTETSDTRMGTETSDTSIGMEASDTRRGTEASDTSIGTEASDTRRGTEASDTSIGTEASDTSIGTEASDTRRGTEASDTSIGTEASDTSIEMEASDTSIGTEASDTSIEMEASDTRRGTEASDTSIGTEASDTSIEMEASDTSIGTETSDTSIGTEAPDTRIGMEASDTSIGTEASDTSIEMEASDTSIGTETSDTSIGTEASDTSIGTEASDTSIGTETPDTRIGMEASDTSIGTETSDTSIGTEASDTSIGTEAPDTRIGMEAPDTRIGTEVSGDSTLTVLSSSSLSAAAADLFLPVLRWDHRPTFPEHLNPHPAAGPAVLSPFAGPLPVRQLVSLGVLQIVLGCSNLLLDFGVLSLSNVPQVNRACLFWAGSSVILSGILGLTSCKRPMIVLANLFIMINIACVLLNLVGFIMACQSIQFVYSISRCDMVDMGEDKICFCCEEPTVTRCSEETMLKLYHVKSCTTSHLLLKDESQVEGQGQTSDRDGVTSPVLSPCYGATCYSSSPQTNSRMLCSDMIPPSHIYGGQIRSIDLFCVLDPPPPYEAVRSSEQEGERQISVEEVVEEEVVDLGEASDRQDSQGEEIPESSSRESLSPSNASLVPAEAVCRRAFNPLRKRSQSDPVLYCQLHQGAVLSHEAAMQTEVKPQLWPVTLQKSLRARALRGRPQSLIKYKPYTDIKHLVAWKLKKSSWSMKPDIHKSVKNVESTLKSDEKHIAEAITGATILEQVRTPAQ